MLQSISCLSGMPHPVGRPCSLLNPSMLIMPRTVADGVPAYIGSQPDIDLECLAGVSVATRYIITILKGFLWMIHAKRH